MRVSKVLLKQNAVLLPLMLSDHDTVPCDSSEYHSHKIHRVQIVRLKYSKNARNTNAEK